MHTLTIFVAYYQGGGEYSLIKRTGCSSEILKEPLKVPSPMFCCNLNFFSSLRGTNSEATHELKLTVFGSIPLKIPPKLLL